MSEESFLHYRLEVARTLADGPYKTALMDAIQGRLAGLRGTRRVR